MSSKSVLALVIFIAFFVRFWDLKWGTGYFFQPDENNMATAVSQFGPQNLNPHFFAYGQFPLYLGYFSLNFLRLPNTFANSIYILRFWSAAFSTLTVFIFYLIFPDLIFVLLLALCPGLIQLAHFGTTESLLILVFALNLYLAKLILKNSASFKLIFFASMVSGIGLAAKISALIFITPVALALLFSLFRKKKFFTVFWHGLVFILLTAIFAADLSPYNLLDFPDFISSLTYETQVATGQMHVFYTSQFLHTIPYLFQFEKIFPYVWGLPVFIFSLISLIFLIITSFRKLKKPYIFVFTFSCLVYFLYFGHVYTKWTRFMSPLFFLGPLLAVLLLNKLPRSFKIPLIILCLFPGIYFFINLFLFPDIRLTASDWINQNLPANAAVLSEAGNVVNLPLSSPGLNVDNFDFYNLDSNPDLPSKLASELSVSDYILIPSRRIFKNQSTPDFPVSQKYYTNLFSGSLGFQPLKTFYPQTDLLLNPENAEETWSVFDHPTIRLYQKYNPLTLSQYETLLQP